MALQMTCPYCKREFPYNNGKLDKEISEIGQRIHEIQKRLTYIKFGRHDDETWHEKKRLTKELAGLQVRISELKAVRKAGDQQIKEYEYMYFKEVVKERYGEAAYKSIIAEVDRELQAYKASGLMRHEYTRSPSKANVTSINKL